MQNLQLLVQESNEEEFSHGYLMGQLIGDGTFAEGLPIISLWISKKYTNYRDYIPAQVIEDFAFTLDTRSDFKGFNKHSDVGDYTKYSLKCVALKEISDAYRIFPREKCVPYYGSQEFNRGMLSGFFDSDGSIQGNQEKGVSIRLGQSDLERLKVVQKLLLSFGVQSKVYQGRRPEGNYLLPDGHGGMKKYHCKESHELVISKSDVAVFQKEINFVDNEKRNKLDKLLMKYKRDIYRSNFKSKVVGVNYLADMGVYDCNIEGVHMYDSNGFISHNCNEISLKPFCFCNLTDINVSDVYNQEDFEGRVYAASLIGTLQASYTDFHYLRSIWQETTEKEALLGVSMTGIASCNVSKLYVQQAANIAVGVNLEFSSVININPASRITTIKPSGTASLIIGTSSGIHAWYSPYYIRTLRVNKDEAIYIYLLEKIPELVEDEIIGQGAVISIPMQSPSGAILRNETAIDMLERIKFFHEKWIRPGHRSGANTHNVSATISIRENEWDEVGNWMWDNRNSYNGLSVLPYDGGNYHQAPFQECTKEKYEEMLQYLKQINLEDIKEFDDNTAHTDVIACAGGACEII